MNPIIENGIQPDSLNSQELSSSNPNFSDISELMPKQEEELQSNEKHFTQLPDEMVDSATPNAAKLLDMLNSMQPPNPGKVEIAPQIIREPRLVKISKESLLRRILNFLFPRPQVKQPQH